LTISTKGSSKLFKSAAKKPGPPLPGFFAKSEDEKRLVKYLVNLKAIEYRRKC
jgi:hypothetical protein